MHKSILIFWEKTEYSFAYKPQTLSHECSRHITITEMHVQSAMSGAVADSYNNSAWRAMPRVQAPLQSDFATPHTRSLCLLLDAALALWHALTTFCVWQKRPCVTFKARPEAALWFHFHWPGLLPWDHLVGLTRGHREENPGTPVDSHHELTGTWVRPSWAIVLSRHSSSM